jgi:FlaA1/EpsC-like NDP-sugar epimerase
VDAPLKLWAARMRNRHVFLLDLILIVVSVWGSFALAVGWSEVLPTYGSPLLTMLLLSLVVKPLVYHLFGLYRRIWTYASVDELKLIAQAVTAASLIIAPVMLVAFYLGWLTALPRSARALTGSSHC